MGKKEITGIERAIWFVQSVFAHCILFPILTTFWLLVSFPQVLQKLVTKRTEPIAMSAAAKSEVEKIGRHVTIRGATITHSLVVAGPEKGKMILFLHGFPESWYSWRHQIEFFSAQGYYCVAPSLRGYGETSKPEHASDYNIHHLLSDVNEIIINCGRDKCILFAHDWGSTVAFSFAHVFPEMVEMIIMGNCVHPALYKRNMSVKQMMASWYIVAFQIPFFPEATIEYNDFKFIGSAFKGKSSGVKKKEAITDVDIEILRHEFSRPGVSTAALNYYRNVFRVPQYVTDAVTTTKLAVPVLVIWGRDDKFLTLRSIQGLDSVCCGVSKMIVLDGVSHWVQQEAASEFNTHANNFIKEHLEK